MERAAAVKGCRRTETIKEDWINKSYKDYSEEMGET